MKPMHMVHGVLFAALSFAGCDRHEATTAVSPPTPPATSSLTSIGSPVPSAASTADSGSVAETMQQPDSPGAGLNEEPVNGPLGDVTLSLLLDGGTIADVERALSSLKPRLRLCYNRGLKVNPNIAGALVLEVTRDETGAAHAVTMLANKGITDHVAECALGVVKGITRLPRTPTSFRCRVEFRIP